MVHNGSDVDTLRSIISSSMFIYYDLKQIGYQTVTAMAVA